MILPESGLPDIRWIAGGSCGGKTISSLHISQKTGLTVYNEDAHRQNHFKRADPVLHPALSREIIWPDFFSSKVPEIFSFWEALCFERMEMILEDLSRIKNREPLLAEGVYPPPEILTLVTPKAPAVFLFADDAFLHSCYYGRESTLWMEGPFSTCRNPERVKEEWMAKWQTIDADRQKRASDLGYTCLEANTDTQWNTYEDAIMKELLL